MIVKCVICERKLRCPPAQGDDRHAAPVRTARAILRDPGERGDGTGGLFIVMPYVLVTSASRLRRFSMSAAAGPYCPEDALRRVNELNMDPEARLEQLARDAVDLMGSQQAMRDDGALEDLAGLVRQAYELGRRQP